MSDPSETDLAQLIDRVRSSTNREELRRFFFGALDRLEVKYWLGLAVDWDADGEPRGAVVVQSLPVRLSFERFSERYPRLMKMVASLVEGGAPVEIDEESAAAFGEDWREVLLEAFSQLEHKWCFVVPGFRGGQLKAVGFYLAEKKLSPEAKQQLIKLSAAGFEKLTAVGLLPPPTSPLTQRQREVLKHCALGKSDWEIAQLLGISQVTAHEHVESAKRKLGVRTRVQAVALATQNRWI